MEKAQVTQEFVHKVLPHIRGNALQKAMNSYEMHYASKLSDKEQVDFAKVYLGHYEFVKSPEEIIREKYKKERHRIVSDPANKWEADAYANGIVFTLEALGIEIEGVNKVGDSDVPKSN